MKLKEALKELKDSTPPPPVPPFIVNGEILIRGTEAWDYREKIRKLHGAKALSFGTLTDV